MNGVSEMSGGEVDQEGENGAAENGEDMGALYKVGGT